MERAHPLFVKTVLTFASLLATGGALAGGSLSSSEPARKSTNTFTILYTATGPNAPVVSSPNGTGVPSSKAVVTNPYNVPLIQNAGLLKPGH